MAAMETLRKTWREACATIDEKLGARHKKFLPRLMVFCLGIWAFTQVVGFVGFRMTPSIPYRVFFVNRLDRDFYRDDLMAFRFKGSRYYRKGTMMVKFVRCLPGQDLEVRGRDFYCDGEYLGRAKDRDSQGNPAPLFVWHGIIPEGEYFVMAPHPDSYDSRYWGFVRSDEVIGKAIPLF